LTGVTGVKVAFTTGTRVLVGTGTDVGGTVVAGGGGTLVGGTGVGVSVAVAKQVPVTPSETLAKTMVL
jgi:hypothetical protein